MDSDLLELIIFGAVILFSVLSSLFKKKQPDNDRTGPFPGNQNQWPPQQESQSPGQASSNDILREIENLFKQGESQSKGYESSQGYESRSYDETTGSMDTEESEYEGSTKNYQKSNYREGRYSDFSYKNAGYKDQHFEDFETTVKKSSYELSQEDLAEIERQKELAGKYTNSETESVNAPYEAPPTSTTAGGSNQRVKDLVSKIKDGKSMREAVIFAEIINRPKFGRRQRWT